MVHKLFPADDIYVQAVFEFLTFDFHGFIQSNARGCPPDKAMAAFFVVLSNLLLSWSDYYSKVAVRNSISVVK